MRWVERVAGALAGLLAIVAGALSATLPADLVMGSTAIFGPGESAILRQALLAPVAVIILAALVVAAVALLDAPGPWRHRMLVGLGLVAAALCAAVVGALLAGDTNITYVSQPFSPNSLILQYNAGALFIPALLAVVSA